jgi:hypothetical protein
MKISKSKFQAQRISKNHIHVAKRDFGGCCKICQVRFAVLPVGFIAPSFEDACEVCDVVGQCDLTCSFTAYVGGLPAYGSVINAVFDEELWLLLD